MFNIYYKCINKDGKEESVDSSDFRDLEQVMAHLQSEIELGSDIISVNITKTLKRKEK